MNTINITSINKAGRESHITKMCYDDYWLTNSSSHAEYIYLEFSNCTFSKYIERDSVYVKCKFSNCTFDRSDISRCTFRDCDFEHCLFTQSNLYLTEFAECQFVECDFTNMKMSGVESQMSKLIRCSFKLAVINSCKLDKCLVNCAQFKHISIVNSGARLTNFDGSIFNSPLGDTLLDGCDIGHVGLIDCDRLRRGVVLTKPIIGYKKTYEDIILTALIPAGAIVFSINGRKCRTNRALITDTCGRPMLHSQYDHNFRYSKGQEVIITDFDLDYRRECSTGFHFFKSLKEAEDY